MTTNTQMLSSKKLLLGRDYSWFLGASAVLYIALHYLILAPQSAYGASPLDETTCVILFPLAAICIFSRQYYVPFALIFLYCLCLITSAILNDAGGVPQPQAAIVAALLDVKVAVMLFSLSMLFAYVRKPSDVFIALFYTFCIIALVDLPFVLVDFFRSTGFKGEPLLQKAGFSMPHGLFLHQNETSWLYAYTAFALAALFRLKHNRLYLYACAGSFLIVILTLSIKEILGSIVGLGLLLQTNRLRRSGSMMRLMFGVVAVSAVIMVTPIGEAVIGHISMFVGDDSIATVRAAMTSASASIAEKYFPLGSGGGTFGSAPSYQMGFSNQYYLNFVYFIHGGGASGGENFLMDVFWPKVLAESGVIGILFYAAFMFWFAAPIFRQSQKDRPEEEAVRLFCCASVILIFVISMASGVFTNELHVFVFALCCSVSASWARFSGKVPTKIRRGASSGLARHAAGLPHEGAFRTPKVG